jgi:hypothetical protein
MFRREVLMSPVGVAAAEGRAPNRSGAKTGLVFDRTGTIELPVQQEWVASMFLFLTVLTLVLVICLWIVGDLEFRTKLVFTVLYVASFAFLLAREQAYLFHVSQCVLAAVIGIAVFGIDFLK